MLVEIRSPVFRTGAIPFSPGLNVVLGDENATNSIGKSTLLMIVDYGFGGSDLLQHNSDLVQELGHHDYFFTFRFDGDLYRYRRGTNEPTITYRCNDAFEPEAVLSLEEYTAFLKHAYQIDLPDLSFRALVSLYMRVWGKDNLSVERPLHIVQAQSSRECINTLIKAFGRYGSIRELSERLTALESKSKAVAAAMRHDILPSISRRDYVANQQRIVALESELDDIKANLAKYATNLSEVVNKEVLELKVERDALLSLRVTVAGRLKRTQQNLTTNRHIQSKHFSDLAKFVPEINQERLAKIEEFHDGVAKLLRSELRESESSLAEQIEQIDAAVSRIDGQMAQALGSISEPTALVDHVFKVAVTLQEIRETNQQFESDTELRAAVRNLKSELAAEKAKVLEVVQSIVNDGLRRIVTSVFGADRKSPQLTLQENRYWFEVFEDTGTGTAYASLIILDLTVFLATQLPVIAHDSVLFKNIENDSVARLLRVYMQTDKQSFIALDEIEKYGSGTAAVLRERSVVQLDDAHVLYIKDWRK